MPGTAAATGLGTAHGEGEPGRTRSPAQIPRSQIDIIFFKLIFFPFLFFFRVFSVGQAGQLFPRFPPLLPALTLSAVALGSDNFISQQLQKKNFFQRK